MMNDQTSPAPLNPNPSSSAAADFWAALKLDHIPGFPATREAFLLCANQQARDLIQNNGWTAPDDQTLADIVLQAWQSAALLYQAAGGHSTLLDLIIHVQNFLNTSLHGYSCWFKVQGYWAAAGSYSGGSAR